MGLNLILDMKNPAGRPYRIQNGGDPYKGKYIATNKKKGKTMLSVMPCGSHESPVVAVPVEVSISENGTLRVVGKAKACPICWEILRVDSTEKELKKLLDR